MTAISKEKISVVALVLLITGAIDSIRNLPGTALFGSQLIFFLILSALVFLIPVALVAAELASTWSEEEGGIYSWVMHAFGPKTAFVTLWLQWINTMVWFPSMLSFIAGTSAYLINPNLVNNKIYFISIILGVFWFLTLLALTGIRASSRFAGICALFGLLLPMGFIIGLALLWVFQGHPIAIDLSVPNLLPQFKNTQSWVSLTAIMTSFLGMELAAVHVRNIDNPQKNFPKAMLFSVILILVTVILGSLAIAFVLPQNKINLVGGVMEAFTSFLNAYQLSYLMPVLVILLLIGSVGSMVNWIIAPAKGLLLASSNGFLPQALYKLNRFGMPSRVLLIQATLVTLLCTGFLLLPSINAIYWLFTDLSTELYILMYVLMFIAALKLKTKFPNLPRPFAIPGKKLGYWIVCLLGLLGCTVTLVIGFIPPSDSIDVGGVARFQLIFSTGLFIMIIPAFILCLKQKYWQKKETTER